jgi:hypothetical protein
MFLLQYVYHSTEPYSKTTIFNLKYFMVINVLPFNRNFNQSYTIFNRGVIPSHYKYICNLALYHPEDGHMNCRNMSVVIT